MAQLFSRPNAESATAVVCGYGEESAIREASRSGGVDAGAVMVIAAVAIPNLLRARIAANESSAVATIRIANVAQVTYSSTYPQKGYARDFATLLGPDPRDPASSSAGHANLVEATLGNPSCTAGAWCTKSGYQFAITSTCKVQRCNEYVVSGTPVSSSTGGRSFCSTEDAVIRVKPGAALTSPVSVAECLTWAPLH
jgi:type II secretory pathway pseudopilin PulG